MAFAPGGVAFIPGDDPMPTVVMHLGISNRGDCAPTPPPPQ